MVTHWQNFLLTNFLFMLTFYIRVSSNFSIIIIMSRLSLIIISYNNCNFFFELQTVSLTWKLQISMAGFHNLLQLHLQRFSGYDMILPKRLLPLVDQRTDIVINSVFSKLKIEPVLVTLANLLPPTLMTCHSSYLKKCFVSMQSELQNLLTKPDQWNQNNLHFLQFRCYWNLIQHDGNIIDCWQLVTKYKYNLCQCHVWSQPTLSSIQMFSSNRTHEVIAHFELECSRYSIWTG